MHFLPPLCHVFIFFLALRARSNKQQKQNNSQKNNKNTNMKKSQSLSFFSNTPTVSVMRDKFGNNYVPNAPAVTTSPSALSSDVAEPDTTTPSTSKPAPIKKQEADNDANTTESAVIADADDPYSIYEIEWIFTFKHTHTHIKQKKKKKCIWYAYFLFCSQRMTSRVWVCFCSYFFFCNRKIIF